MNEFLNQLDDNLRQFLSLGSNALDASRDITKDINFATSELKKDGSLLTKYDLLVEEKIFEILKDSNADIVTEEVLEKKENKDFLPGKGTYVLEHINKKKTIHLSLTQLDGDII